MYHSGVQTLKLTSCTVASIDIAISMDVLKYTKIVLWPPRHNRARDVPNDPSKCNCSLRVILKIVCIENDLNLFHRNGKEMMHKYCEFLHYPSVPFHVMFI